MSAFLGGLAVQFRVIHALMMRESLTRYGKGKLGFLWFFLSPVVFTLGLVGLRSVLGGAVATVGNGILLPVLISGYSSMLLWRGAGGRCLNAIRSNEALLMHRNVTVQDVLIARLVLEVVGVTASTLAMFVVGISFGLIELPSDVVRMAGGWAVIIAFSVGLGFLLAALGERYGVIERVWPWLSLLFIPLSGVATIFDWMPVPLRDVAYWFPVVHGLELFRYGHVGGRMVPHYDLYYGVAGSIGLIVLGNVMLRASLRKELCD
jgi:capsular polysaccharide transport system permease protein